ncbi:MAG: hypothetical protein ACD_10C00249G0001, partial [uncultured bacterium]
MLDPGTGFGNPLVTPLLAFRQRLVPLALALDMIAPSRCLELGLPGIRRIAPVGIDIPA